MAGGPPSVLNPPPEAAASQEVRYYEYPSSLLQQGGDASMDNYMMFEAKDFKLQQPTLNIAMYIPGGALNTSYKSSYESVQLGGAGSVASDVAGAVEKAVSSESGFSLDAFTKIAGATQSGLQSELGTVSTLKMADKVSGIGGLEGTRTLMERTTGAVLNPFTVAAYKGPTDMRDFSFDFQMLPQNEDESKSCLKIANAFKKAMLPSHSGGDSSTAPSMLFGYPDTFEITFYIGGKKLPDSNKNPMFNIGKSVLTACELNFDTENVPLFFKGTQYPVSIAMKLSFMELDIMYREKIDKGM